MVTGKPGLKKLVYAFSEGDASMTDLLGGKDSNLCEMFRLGLPVPPGFVISTETCLEYFNLGNRLPDGLTTAFAAVLGRLKSRCGESSARWSGLCWYPRAPAPGSPCRG